MESVHDLQKKLIEAIPFTSHIGLFETHRKEEAEKAMEDTNEGHLFHSQLSVLEVSFLSYLLKNLFLLSEQPVLIYEEILNVAKFNAGQIKAILGKISGVRKTIFQELAKWLQGVAAYPKDTARPIDKNLTVEMVAAIFAPALIRDANNKIHGGQNGAKAVEFLEYTLTNYAHIFG